MIGAPRTRRHNMERVTDAIWYHGALAFERLIDTASLVGDAA